MRHARPDLVVLGHVTRDEFADGVRLGGAGAFVAQAAVALGLRCALVTGAPIDDPLLAPLRALPDLDLRVVPAPGLTTFALDYEGPRRRLFLKAAAPAIHAAAVPDDLRGAPVLYAGPVAGECDAALLAAAAPGFAIAGLQGWLRRAGPAGEVQPALAPEALAPPALGAAVLSEEDHPDAEAIAARFAAAGAAVAVTRGARGATVLAPPQRFDVPAAPAREVDPTGAGDVFGLVFGLALAQGRGAAEAATLAAEAAARVVEGPGLGRLEAFARGRGAALAPRRA